jgi:hypothetical protein
MVRPLTVVFFAMLLGEGCTPQAPLGPPPPAVPYRSGPLVMGQWGVGPIRPLTYFESPVIRRLFPAADVEDATVRISFDETEAAIMVKQDGTPMLEIDDGTANAPGTDDPMIGAVRALGGPVRGPAGERIGMSWKAARFDLSECEIGGDRDANTVICARPRAGAVTFYFTTPGWDSGELPPPGRLDRTGYLTAMVWTPPPAPRAKGS